MDYIGYTSVISGGDSPVVYDYIKWNYGAEDGGKDTVTYPLGYFFPVIRKIKVYADGSGRTDTPPVIRAVSNRRNDRAQCGHELF